MDPIDFGGYRSKFKVTIDMYGNKLVKITQVKGEGHEGHQMWGTQGCYALRCYI